MAEFKKMRVAHVGDEDKLMLFGVRQPELDSYESEGISEEVQEFMAELRKGIRGIKFGHYQGSSIKVSVYMEGQPYTMGYIGFFDHRQNPKKDVDHYVVYSHNIENGKYDQYSDQHYMAASINLSTAVKNAKKYLRSFTTAQLAYEEYVSIQDDHTDIDYNLRRDVRQAKEKIQDHNDFYNEMNNLIAVGHKFINAEFANCVQEYVTTRQDEKQSRKKAAVFVRHYERRDKNVFDVVEIPDVTTGRNKVLLMGTTTYSEEELPKHIMDGISVLQILPEENKDRRRGTRGTYVDGVGHKVGDNMYFVLV